MKTWKIQAKDGKGCIAWFQVTAINIGQAINKVENRFLDGTTWIVVEAKMVGRYKA